MLSEKCQLCDLIGHQQPAQLATFSSFHFILPIVAVEKQYINFFDDVIKPKLYALVNKGPPARLS
jgi:hypothetical protein